MLEVRIKKLGMLTILSLQGRIVIGETAILRDTVHTLKQVSVLLIDLGGVTVVDAAGLGLLIEVREELKAKGIDLKLTNTTDRVNQIFEITRLNTVFEITSAVSLLGCITQTNHLPRCA